MRHLFVFVIMFALVACGKEPVPYPVKQYEQFNYHGLTHFGNYRLFTKKGEITNTALVTQYTNNHSQFFYTASSNFSIREYKAFSFVNDDSVVNMGIVPVGELKRTVVGDYDVFKSKFTVPINDTNTLNLHLGKYKLFDRATTTTGYSYFELNDPAVVLKKMNDKVYLPMVRYIVTSIGENAFSFSSDRFNNVFDPTGINKLGSNDTLLIQTFDVELRKMQ